MGFWFLMATLFLAAQVGWRSAPADNGTVTTLDGGAGQPPSPKAP